MSSHSDYGFCWLPKVEEDHALDVELSCDRLTVLYRVREGVISLIDPTLRFHIYHVDVEAGGKHAGGGFLHEIGGPKGRVSVHVGCVVILRVWCRTSVERRLRDNEYTGIVYGKAREATTTTDRLEPAYSYNCKVVDTRDRSPDQAQ